ncbi:hypothetical protein LTR56_022009 [Elasticomyces elasticus]|nr:hypothetical protein LTR56_022009 [Elasticomyces elasticus]KAK3635025.1 hypothetical protein LTR22_019381 [Elasticomyces elasticus]KAK4915794.1 hypothetical protein LTR49_016163 [Elasticomyces elasticus]KAK5749456.1 hypothetical protein LTS12_020505 [Elasticomyces elasticus]
MSVTFDPDFLDRVLTKPNADHDVVELFMQFLLDVSTAGSGSEELSTSKFRTASALFHNYYFKRVLIDNTDGSRKTNDQLYGGDDKIELMERFTKSLFEESDADVFVV